MANLIFLLLIGVMFYVLLIRGPRQRARRQQATVAALEVGDEVVSIGGIIGRVTAVEGDRIVLQVSPGVDMTFLRAGIRGKLEPPVPDEGESGDPVDLTDRGAHPDDDGEA